MPYFSVISSNKLVITNFKVMFSSFKKSQNFKKLKRFEARLLIAFKNPDVYFMVRDPYQKAISFYKDKFQKIPSQADFSKPFKWEKPQRVFFPLLGLCVKKNTPQEIKKRLMDTSFDEFVILLAQCYHLDEHVHPQYWILQNPVYGFLKSLGLKKHNITIFKMDRAEDMSEFVEATQFDFSKPRNSTANITMPKISEESLAILNHIYKRDFEDFGYPVRQH